MERPFAAHMLRGDRKQGFKQENAQLEDEEVCRPLLEPFPSTPTEKHFALVDYQCQEAAVGGVLIWIREQIRN